MSLTSHLPKYFNNKWVVFTTVFLLAIVFANPVFGQIAFGVECRQGLVYIAVFDMCMDFGQTIGLVVSWSLILGTLIALGQFSIGAIRMITSTGQPNKLEEARETITDAVLGLILITTAWVLLGFISSSFPPEWGISFFVLPFGVGGPTTP